MNDEYNIKSKEKVKQSKGKPNRIQKRKEKERRFYFRFTRGKLPHKLDLMWCKSNKK